MRAWEGVSIILCGVIATGLLPSSADAGSMIYSVAEPTPFDISDSDVVLRGSIGPVSAGEAASWDLSTSGNDPNAPPGTHACADLSFNPFASCFIEFTLPPVALDLVAYRVTLDPDSDPVSTVFVTFTLPPQVAYDNASYIIPSDPGPRIPSGQVFGGNGGGVVFQSFSSPTDPSFYLQPGETTVVLLSHFAQGDVENALSAGSTPRFTIQEGSSGPPRGGVIDVSFRVPEPSASLLAACALLLVRTLSRRRR